MARLLPAVGPSRLNPCLLKVLLCDSWFSLSPPAPGCQATPRTFHYTRRPYRIAVVGSRNVDEEGHKFTHEVGQKCAKDGVSIISGGAKGVDKIAILSSLDAGGTAVGVLADSLMRACVSEKYRKAILDQRLLLFSPFNPEAPFNVGNAMGRNKYIYALSRYGLVISTDREKGGTWAGAIEELSRKNNIPVFVRMEGNVPSGNRELLKLGALAFPLRPWNKSFITLLEEATPDDIKIPEQTILFNEVKKETTKYED